MVAGRKQTVGRAAVELPNIFIKIYDILKIRVFFIHLCFGFDSLKRQEFAEVKQYFDC